MAEPHSTALGVAVGAGIGLTGTVMGAQVDALLIGLMAAILISFWLPTVDDRKKAAAAVALSSLFSGYGAVWAAQLLATKLAIVLPHELLALLIGVACPTMVPATLGLAKRKVENQS
jgi:hypothetical protein